MKGAPGMPLGAMAQVRPNFFSVAQPSGPHSSTDRQPSALATSQVLARLHFSPALLKHQKTTDCLMLSLTTALPSSARAGRASEAAPAAAMPDSHCRRDEERMGVLPWNAGLLASYAAACRRQGPPPIAWPLGDG